MVNVDRHACCTLAEKGYRDGLWLESYVTWDFLDEYPKAMEPGYLSPNWDHIPGMYLCKVYMRNLVIEKEEWDHLSNPVQLPRYWEPTQAPGDFHWMFTLAFCWTVFHDCEDSNQKKEYVVLVAIVQKLAQYVGLPFSTVAEEFRDDVEVARQAYCLSGCTGTPRCFWTSILTGTNNISPWCMTPGYPTMCGIPRSLWVPYFTTDSRPGMQIPP